MEFLFNSLWGWLSIASIVVIAAIAVAVFFPPLRKIALTVAAGAIAYAAIYAKGARDRAALEQRRKDAAVKKVQERYDEIDKRPDDAKSVKGRLDKGTF